ncbi:MAG: tetratricopeptide repeat protein [Candidatus Zixiibacteriota bacterium]
MRNLVMLLLALAALVSSSCSSGSKDAGPANDQKEPASAPPVAVGEPVLAGDDSTNAFVEQGQNLEKQLLYYDALYQYLLAYNKNKNLIPAASGIARTLMRLDFPEETERAAGQYAAIAGNYYPAHYDLARLYIYLRDYPRAEQHIEKAIQAGMESQAANLVKARIEALRGDIDSARQTATSLLTQISGSAIFYYEAAEYLESIGWVDSAMALSRMAYAAEGAGFDLRYDHFLRALRNYYLIDARLMMKDFKSKSGAEILSSGLEYRYRKTLNQLMAASMATAQIKNLSNYCLSANLIDVEARGPIFDYLIGTDDLDQSFMAVDKEKDIPDFKNMVQYRIARKYLIVNDYNKARKHFNQMSGWRMQSRDYKLTDLFMLYNTGQFEEFEKQVTPLLEQYGDEPVWLTGIADIYAYKLIHLYDRAEELYRRALEKDKWYRPAFDNMLAMFRELREYGKVLKLMDDYSHFGNDLPANRIMKSFALAELDRFDEGTKLFKDNIAPVKGNVSLYEELINIFMRKNEFDRAGDIVRFMLEQEPNNPEMLVLAAVTYSDLMKYEQAYRQAEKALAVEPDNLEALVQKAFVTYQLGNKEEGYKLMGQLLKDYLGDKTVNLYASRMYINDNKEMGKVGNWSRSALSKDRYGLKSYLNLSDYYLRLKKYNFARQHADNAVAVFDNDPRAYFVQGRALFYEKENLDEARKSLQKAIDLGLKGDDLAEAKKLLSEI